jgi:hypothetical protein
LIESLPEVAQKLRQTLQVREGSGPKPAGAIDKVQQAAAEFEHRRKGRGFAERRASS